MSSPAEHFARRARSVDGHPLPIDELKGTKSTERIDLSGKGLGVASAIIIASCIKGNGSLKALRCVTSHSRSAPNDTCGSVVLVARSLSDNHICGINKYGKGTYTAEGINALCEGLKGSAITSLKCARPPQTHERTAC